MAIETDVASDRYHIFAEGEWHDIIIVCRDSSPQIDAMLMAELMAATLGVWLRAWRAIKRDTWQIEDAIAPELKLKIKPRTDGEPRVSIHNHTFTGLSITVHSHNDGIGALAMAASQFALRYLIKDKMAFLFNPNNETPAKTEKQETPQKRDINDVDSFLANETQEAGNTQKSPQTGQIRAFVRPAKLGTIEGTIKLEKGQKDKLTYETAILATKPYSYGEVQYQEKDLVVYPIQGAIKFDGNANGYYFVIPVPNRYIHIKIREGTQWNGKTIPSDSQTLAKHLGVSVEELSQGDSFDVPATHIALKIGKVETKEDGSLQQYKNYSGLYCLA